MAPQAAISYAENRSVDAAVFVDRVALAFEEGCLGRRMGAVQAAVGGDHPPPRQVRRGPQDVGDGLAAARPPDLLGQLAVGDDVARLQLAHGIDDRTLERGQRVAVGPRPRPRRRGEIVHGDHHGGRWVPDTTVWPTRTRRYPMTGRGRPSPRCWTSSVTIPVRAPSTWPADTVSSPASSPAGARR